MVAPEIGTFPVNIGVLLTATDANADPITFRTMLNSVTVLSVFSENVIANASIETDGTFVVLAIDGGVLNPIVVTSTQFNISIVASDGMADSEPCVLSVVIQYLQAAECRPAEEVRSNSEQASSDPTATRQFFAVRVPLIVAEVSRSRTAMEPTALSQHWLELGYDN